MLTSSWNSSSERTCRRINISEDPISLAFTIKRTGKAEQPLKFPDNCRILAAVCLFLVLVIISSVNQVSAEDSPFSTPTNWGGTGLMETPSARVIKDGRLRAGFTTVKPYNYYYGAISPIRGLEIDGRITEIMDIPALTANYGNYKDKAVDIKWQFLPEGKWWPAMAMGIMDPQGTRLYASQYIVASKQIFPFDFTIGFGNGRYGKQPLPASGESFKMEMFTDNASWRENGQLFGGIQFAVTDWLMLMAEYNPIRYEKQTNDPAQVKYFQDGVPSNFNFGIRVKPWDWLEADLSWQRGNQLGFNVSFAVDFSGPFIPIYDHPYREKPEFSRALLEERITLALYESGFSNIGVKKCGDELWVEAANNKYYYNMKAVGVSLKAIHRIIMNLESQELRTLHLILTDNGIPVVEFVTNIGDMQAYYADELSVNEYLYLSEIKTNVWDTPKVVREHWRYFDYVLKPDFKLFLNDPSGFLNFRLGVAADVLLTPWKGGTFAAGLLGYPINTISSSNQPSATPVRTDIIAYQKQNVELGILLFNQIQKFKYETYGMISLGYLEEQYAGLDWEVAKPLLNGRFLMGLSGSVVKKREPNNIIQLKENDWKDQYVTGFFKVRLNIPEVEINIDLKNGQFLAGDRGTSITVSKNFNGVILSAWYSITDTSVFTDSYNIGYHDKGIAISVPLRMFAGRDSKTVYRTAISPWTRDVAQDIGHFNNLFDFIGRNVNVYADKDKVMIQE
jgi:hypothetical protein